MPKEESKHAKANSTINLHVPVSAIKLVAVQEQTICQLGRMVSNLLALAQEMDWSLRKQDVCAHNLHCFQAAFATSAFATSSSTCHLLSKPVMDTFGHDSQAMPSLNANAPAVVGLKGKHAKIVLTPASDARRAIANHHAANRKTVQYYITLPTSWKFSMARTSVGWIRVDSK